MNMSHCLEFICLYEKTHKSASLFHFFLKSEAVTYVTPDVINGQAHCLYVRYA